jgi:molybdopterin-containing oxidoreductase family iron-sulfur binding subunit
MKTRKERRYRYAMLIDVDRCTGCGACMVACAVENNVPPVPPGVDERRGVTWMRVYRATGGNAAIPAGGENEEAGTAAREAFFPIPCQHCDRETPCVAVCPQNAVERDGETGIVTQVPARCLGCRYCMAACPYHARYFNWWDPVRPGGADAAMNPDVSPRMRGVVEKCNFCHGRLQAARARAAAQGWRDLRPEDYVPACVEACPAGAIVFGNLADPESEAARLSKDSRLFRLLEKLGTEPKVYYLSARAWVRRLGESVLERATEGRHA